MHTGTLPARGPAWLAPVAALGAAWNAYGLYQFLTSLRQTRESLMGAGMNGTGMTSAQADLYLSLPAWISIAFAVGVFGGLVGSVALMMRKAIALPILAASFTGYVFLFAGDVHYGVFANIPSQLVILAVVVAIAATLLWIARYSKAHGLLA